MSKNWKDEASMTIEDPELSVLKWIKPRKEDRDKAMKVFSEVKEKLEKAIGKTYSNFEVVLEGSMAKDTWLRNNPEMDVFVIFNEELTKDELRNFVNRLAKELSELSPITSYAEHPYLTLSIGKFSIDIVPALKIESINKPRTAVDRTPLHTKFVLEHTDETLRDEIRVAKAFMRGIGVYGAEVKVGGFSGYLIELLIIKYGGFRELLKASKTWKPPIVIGLKDMPEKAKELKERYPNSVMLFPDPVDDKRNVAAALTKKKLGEFIMASELYQRNPNIFYFFEKIEDIALKEFNKFPLEIYSEHVIVVDLLLERGLHPDVLWGELKKVASSIKIELEKVGFTVANCESWTNEKKRAAVACRLEERVLEPISYVVGPPFVLRENSIKFIEKYLLSPMSGPWIDDSGRLHSLTIRKKRSPLQVIEEGLNNILPEDLRRGEFKVYRLTKDKLLSNDDISKWLKLFCFSKPRWLLPAYLAKAGIEVKEEELFEKELLGEK
ncbi:MAG: CCA tRNA nucleotidyltransferase [Fervidicoccus sp.]|nr:MAG: CCA tRNA nucleotidyltransferase [Fervidicoccus sp.]